MKVGAKILHDHGILVSAERTFLTGRLVGCESYKSSGYAYSVSG